MDNHEMEENLPAIGEPKLHAGMCKSLCAIYAKVLEIFPELEAARPRSMSGLQALCVLHISLERTKNILQHCAECSKLYLAITGDSVVMKFEKARLALEDGLRRVEDIVPQTIGCQISEIQNELLEIKFSLDPTEKQIGDDIIALLQQGIKFTSNSDDNSELEVFHQAASRLGITSSRAALLERRALKKLVEKARAEEDKRKESIVAYLSHLMRKYSKLFRNDLSDDNDSQGSSPCSPTIQGQFEDSNEPGGNAHAFDRQLSKFNSFNFKPNFRRSGQIPIPPEELRCPISLQLMYDPVIIPSGQTYERICIEKWFNDGHDTCPKTQQHLPHLCLTPNYCVKGLVASWCEQNGAPVPDGPPESLDLEYWRLALSDSENTNANSSLSESGGGFCKSNDVTVTIEEDAGNEAEDVSVKEKNSAVNVCLSYDDLFIMLQKENDLKKKLEVIEKIRHLLKDNEEARIYMGENGLVEALLQFLESAIDAGCEKAQEFVAMALFNVAVNNNRNKETMLAGGILPLLEKMITNSTSAGAATALYLNLSCLEEAKPLIGSSTAVPFLIQILHNNDYNSQCKLDAIHALYNLSICSSNVPRLLDSGVINGLQYLIDHSSDHSLTEKSIAVLINIALSKSAAKDEIISAAGLISCLANILDVGEPVEQEQTAALLVILCNGNDNCSQMVLQEGVIPSLVSISVNGTSRGKQKAQKLLMLFREQRQRDSSSHINTNHHHQQQQQHHHESRGRTLSFSDTDTKPLSKSISRRKVGKAWSFWWKNKSFSVHQY